MRRNVVSTAPFVKVVAAEDLRVGKQLLTDDGWQTIRGLVMFADADQVSVYTDERDDVATSGWRFSFGDFVQTRLTPTAEEQYQQQHRERMERRRRQRAARAAAACPEWCIEHYDGDDGQERQTNHNGTTLTVIGADVEDGHPVEFGFWLERRDRKHTGGTETVVVLETRPHSEDIELTPDAVHLLAAQLQSLGHRAQLHR
ncbi:DUF6907 domain-containing protein [Actinoplanes sp. CA-142083]|uniref:DUF6907 domain-containing protein n=1 Tax=Actinoplanes sp. CA-142083 TaxID=3239903 RepID=UPI003D946643